MSKTFPARPARTQRQTANMANPGRGRPPQQQNPADEAAGGEEPSPQDRKPVYNGAFTVIPPDSKKRERVTTGAKAEEDAYNAYRQRNTPKSFNIVATPGGGQLTMAEARQKQIQDSPSKTQRLLNTQQRKAEQRRHEEMELQKKKDSQREKALRNKQNEEERQNKLEERHKRTNEAFLRRLENQSKRKTAAVAAVDTVPATKPMIRQPDPTTSADRPPDRGQMDQGSGREGTDRTRADPEPDLDEGQRWSLTRLSDMFGQYSREELLAILEQVEFSLEAAVDLLQ